AWRSPGPDRGLSRHHRPPRYGRRPRCPGAAVRRVPGLLRPAVRPRPRAPLPWRAPRPRRFGAAAGRARRRRRRLQPALPDVFLGQRRPGLGAQRPLHRRRRPPGRRGPGAARGRGRIRPRRRRAAPGTGNHCRQPRRTRAVPRSGMAAVGRHPALPPPARPLRPRAVARRAASGYACAMSASAGPVPLSICVLTVSDSRTPDNDTSGDWLVQALQADGHRLADRALLPDDRYQLRARVSQWIADDGVDGIIVTGGTGFTGRDSTPEALLPLL